MDPLVTIVIPCYKLAHLLQQCVNSILRQDYKNFEILIMDNCSPDNTPEVAQSFNDPRVKHIRNETNIGHIRNFNKGISLARGKYVWMVLVDDMLRSPHVLGRYVDLMERNPNVGFVFCRAIEFEEEGEEQGICQWADCGDEDQIWKDRTFFHRLIEANCIVACSEFFRKECYPKPGPYQLEIPWASDWYISCMIAMHFNVAYLAEPMVSVRIHGESLTSQYAKDHARLCIGDEMGLLRRVGHEAQVAGLPSLRDACEAALIRRAVRLLAAGDKEETPGMSQADFETILGERIASSRERKEIQASVCTGLGDEQYWEGERQQAKRSYRLALTARPGRLETWVKYLLLRMGILGMPFQQILYSRYESVVTRYRTDCELLRSGQLGRYARP
jgi:glycosyltransferase involved in cell wall biosynthesis